MNEANILHYLTEEMERLKDEIRGKISLIENCNRRIDDNMKRIQKLKVHYTSLLNTAIAYGYEKDEQEDSVV